MGVYLQLWMVGVRVVLLLLWVVGLGVEPRGRRMRNKLVGRRRITTGSAGAVEVEVHCGRMRFR